MHIKTFIPSWRKLRLSSWHEELLAPFLPVRLTLAKILKTPL